NMHLPCLEIPTVITRNGRLYCVNQWLEEYYRKKMTEKKYSNSGDKKARTDYISKSTSTITSMQFWC
ncbi:MAG: hypothetical protein K6A67_03570, partial [Bacteroidales bacterium]|nr:hypothetical protein [Bacteroidales bacterium]